MRSSGRVLKALLWTAGVCAALVLVVGIAWYFVLSRAQRTVEGEAARCRELGEPVTMADLANPSPQVPPEENAAPIYRQALAVYREHDVSDDNLVGPTEPLSDAFRNDARAYIESNSDTLALLYQARAMPKCEFDIDLTDPSTLLQQRPKLRMAAHLLFIQSVLFADEGRGEEAARAVWTCATTADRTGTEGTMLGYMMRLTSVIRSTRALEQVIGRCALDKASLEQLQEAFRPQDEAALLSRAYATERCYAMNSIPPMGGLGRLLMNDEAMLLRTVRGLITATGLSYEEARKVSEDAQAAADTAGRFQVRMKVILPVLTKVYDQPFEIRSVRTMARTAIAIERYRLDKNELPGQLSDLVPAYLPQLPLDPFNDEPLAYARLDTGYELACPGAAKHYEREGDREERAKFTVPR